MRWSPLNFGSMSEWVRGGGSPLLIYDYDLDQIFSFQIKSVGNLNETSNIEYSKKISEYVQKTLGIGNDRCVIHFHSNQAYEIGKHGTTLKELRK